MDERCPACQAPATEGYPFCGNCGERIEPAPPPPSPLPGPADSPTTSPARSATDVPAPSTADAGLTTDTGSPDTGAAVDPRPEPTAGPPRRRATTIAVVGLLVVAVALLYVGRDPGGPEALASAPAEGGGNAFDVVVPSLDGRVRWEVAGTAPQDVLGPYPWAAPSLTDDHVIVVTPGGVLFQDRRAPAGIRARVELLTSGLSGAAVMDRAEGTAAVIADASAWLIGADGVQARSDTVTLADVTPVALGPSRVVVEDEVGTLRLLAREGPTLEAVGLLRGIDVAPEGRPVPRFDLAVHALDVDGLWVGSQSRDSGDWSLWRVRVGDFTVVSEVPLGDVGTPTVVGADDGAVAVAFDDTVAIHEIDGRVRWQLSPGPGARVLGVDGDRLLVAHGEGRTVLDLATGREVSRITISLVEGARSVVAGGEVLVLERGSVVAVRVSDGTIRRRYGGYAISVATQDERVIAMVILGQRGEAVLRLEPTPDRSALADDESDARDLVLSIPDRCRVVGLDDRFVWHDGEELHAIDLRDGRVLATVPAASSGSSTLASRAGEVLVVDAAGVVRRFTAGLDELSPLPIGDDPVSGAAVAGDLTVVAGGTGRVPSLSTTPGYVRGVDDSGASRWLVSTPGTIASPPVARDVAVAVREGDGRMVLVRDGLTVAQVGVDRRTLDPAALDSRGAVLRDGDDIVAVFPQGEEAWRTPIVGNQPGLATDGDVVVVRAAERVVALDRATGAQRWERVLLDEESADEARPPVPGVAMGPPVLTREGVLVTLANSILRLDRRTGEVTSRADGLPTLTGQVIPTSLGVGACAADGRLLLVS